jgi:hypothetical protein
MPSISNSTPSQLGDEKASNSLLHAQLDSERNENEDQRKSFQSRLEKERKALQGSIDTLKRQKQELEDYYEKTIQNSESKATEDTEKLQMRVRNWRML